MTSLYLIGSLRNPRIPEIANELRLRVPGLDVFDDWHAAGPHADDCWRDYEKRRGHSYVEALQGLASKQVFEFDRTHLERCDMAMLVLPAGKSGHLELGFILGRGKPGFLLLEDGHAQDEAFRYDVMYRFATGVCESLDDAVQTIQRRMP